jgi:hypothetical protein
MTFISTKNIFLINNNRTVIDIDEPESINGGGHIGMTGIIQNLFFKYSYLSPLLPCSLWEIIL